MVQLDPASGVTGTTTFATGLTGECEQLVRGWIFLQPVDSPTERVVWFGDGGMFRFESTAGNEESRLRIGSFASERDFDIVIVEGRRLTTLVDVLKNNTPEP